MILSTRTVRARGKGAAQRAALRDQRLALGSSSPGPRRAPPPASASASAREPGLTRADLDQALESLGRILRSLKFHVRHSSDSSILGDLRTTVQELPDRHGLVLERPDDPAAQLRDSRKAPPGLGPCWPRRSLKEARPALD